MVIDGLASSYFDPNHSWSVEGNFDFLEKDLMERGRELQYTITPMPEMIKTNNITVHNTIIPNFTWKIDLKRILVPYIFETFIPMATMVIVSWISFIVPPEIVPGRAGILVTLLLVLTTFHLREMERCPAFRDPTPLLIWTSVCLSVVSIAIFEYAFILYYIRFEQKKIGITRQIKDILTEGSEEKPIITSVKRKLSTQLNFIPEIPEIEVPDAKSDKKHSVKSDSNKCELFEKTTQMIDYYALWVLPILFALFVLSFCLYVTFANW